MAFVLKTSCNGDLRRVLIDPVAGFKYGQLRSLLQNQFPKLKKSCVTHYVDDEKDLIRIASDAELVEAFRVAKNMGLKSLKIVVSEESKNNNAVKTTQGASAPEPEKKKEPPVLHYGFTCDVSGESPIAGPRFHKKGTNFDLCGAEFEKLTFADQVAFEKIEKPSDPSRRGWWHHKKVSAEAAAFFSREKKAAIRVGWRQHRPAVALGVVVSDDVGVVVNLNNHGTVAVHGAAAVGRTRCSGSANGPSLPSRTRISPLS